MKEIFGDNGLFGKLLNKGELPTVRVELTDDSLTKLYGGLIISGLILIVAYYVAKKA